MAEEAFFRLSSSSVRGTRRHTRASTLSRRSLSGPTPDARTLRGVGEGVAPGNTLSGLKSFFYHHHLAQHLKTLLECERGIGFAHTAVPKRPGQERAERVLLRCDRELHKCCVLVVERKTDVIEIHQRRRRRTIKMSCKVCKILSCAAQSWGTMEIFKYFLN